MSWRTGVRLHGRRAGLALAALPALLVLLVLMRPAAAFGATPLLPNLVADPPSGVFLETSTTEGGLKGKGEAKLLLRFNGYLHNVGPGALDFRGSRAKASEPMKAFQRVFNSDGTFKEEPSSAELIYVSADGHNHFHLQRAAKYSLWNSARSAEAAPALKVGFCLDDSEHVESGIGPKEAVYSDATGRKFCRQNEPEALSLFEGVSTGWRDLYSSNLAFQWVDASNVLPGEYWLREDVNPTGVIKEAGGANAPGYATSPTIIPGFDALAQTVSTEAGTAKTVTLTSHAWKDTATPKYSIVSGPSHGTVNAGSKSDQVIYTPAAGYTGADSFTYAAKDPNSPFPRSPSTATVSIEVVAGGSPSVTIEGAPASMVAGSSVQLSAKVVNDSPGVTWAASAGSITTGGLYTAPAEPPAGGSVVVTATSSKGAKDQRTIEVTSASASALLVGDATSTYGVSDQTSVGREESFQFTAKSSGTVQELQFRTNATANAGVTGVILAVFADSAGKPGEVLGAATASGEPAASSWIKATGLSVAVVSGTKYWLVALPLGTSGKKLHFNAAVGSGGTGNLESVAGGMTSATAQSSWETYNQGPVGFQAIGHVSGAALVAHPAALARSARRATARRATTARTRPVRRSPGRAPARHAVALQGAPSAMIAGTSVQLAAQVAGGSGVNWRASNGRITARGLYTAPTQRPAGGTVVISAKGAHGGRDERRIEIVQPASPQAAPSVPASAGVSPPTGQASSQAVSAPRTMLFAGQLVMTAGAARAGLLTVSAYVGKHRLGGCTVQTPARRSFTCLLDLKGASPRTVTAVASSLRVGHTVLTSSRAATPVVPATINTALLSLLSSQVPSAWEFTCGVPGHASSLGAI